MATQSHESSIQWATTWLDGVANGASTMSQRLRSSIDAKGGGLETVQAVAQEKGVHLLLLEDDRGNELVAASTKPFRIIC